VKTGLVPRELARIYNDLFERRQEADYADFVVFEDVQVQPWIASATRFVGQISRLAEDSST